MKLTPRQNEVMNNLARITTDGSRIEPKFWLGEKNVSKQVRSLIKYGLLELHGARLIATENRTASTPAGLNTDAAIDAMRDLLGG